MSGLFLGFYLGFIIIIGLIYKDFGVSWDESFYLGSGRAVAESFFNAPRIIREVPLYHLLTHGTLLDSLYFLAIKLMGNGHSFELLHLAKAVFNSSALVILFLILRRLDLSKAAVLAGVLFLALFPRWFGDIFDNQMDGGSVVFYAWELLFAVLIVQETKRKGLVTNMLLLAVLSALAFSHRVILAFLPVLTWFLFLFKARALKFSWLKSFGVVLTFVAFFVLTLFVVDPYVRYFGFFGILGKVSLPQEFGMLYVPQTLFEGKILSTAKLPWYYLSKWILITSPLVTLIFFVIGILVSIAIFFWQRAMVTEKKLTAALLLLSLFGPLSGVTVSGFPLYDGWRLFLFLVVPMAILASYGFDFFWRSRYGLFRALALVLLVINVFLVVKQMGLLHPYEYLYFNELVGDLPGANGKYETDYWGKSFKEAVVWLRNLDEDSGLGRIRVVTCGDPTQSAYFFSPQMVWTNNLTGADFFICYTRFDQYLLVDQSKTVFMVEREGVPLSYVMRLR